MPVLLITKLLYLYTNRRLLARSVDKGWSLLCTLYFGSRQKSVITCFLFLFSVFRIWRNTVSDTDATPMPAPHRVTIPVAALRYNYGAYWSKDSLIDSWQFVKCCYTFQFLMYKFQLNGNKRAIETTGTHNIVSSWLTT